MINRLKARWNDFFFAEEVPYGMALVRMLLPLVLLIGVLPRWWHARELYSTDGSPAPLWINYGASPMVPDLAGPVAVALYSILVVSLIAASLGWMTRVSLVVSCLLYVSFGLLDSVGTLTKYTVISSHALMLLALSQCGSIWSVDAWLCERGESRGSFLVTDRRSPVWPRRLLQLFIGIVYLGAAFTKMHTPAYFSGDQLTFWMLADMNFENPFGRVLTLYPALLTVMAYVTILWEILFICLIWSSFWRLPALALGVGFHLMTYFTLGLIVFPLVYLALYFVFFEPSAAERAAAFFNRQIQRLTRFKRRAARLRDTSGRITFRPSYSLAAWSMVMATAAVIGVEVEHRRDVYGERSGDGRLTLKELDSEQVKEILGPSQRLRPQDMYYAFDVGTRTLGGLLSDRRSTFVHGEQAIVQCSLQPPHPDMWIEVNLHDSENHVIKRIGQVVPRENLRAEFYYHFDDSFIPGEYDFVLRYDGEELTRRRVTLEGPKPALTASR